jgi:predicted ATPase
VLSSLTIAGFRAFKVLNFQNLKRLNLVVGKNNCGKTALLEAIDIVSNASVGQPIVSAVRRGEFLPNEVADQHPEIDVTHLIYGHLVQEDVFAEIKAVQESGEPLVARLQFLQNAGSGESSAPRDKFVAWYSRQKRSLWLHFWRNGKESHLFGVSEQGGVEFERSYTRLVPLHAPPSAPVNFIGVDSVPLGDLARFWDAVAFTPDEAQLIESLKTLDSTIERIAPTASESTRSLGAAFRVKLQGLDGPVPLGTLGAGVRRLFGLALVLVRSSGGVMLVDEIDSGLHHSAMRDMWRMVIQTATRLNIQVFATTHSSDCWQTLGWLCATDPEIAKQVSVHRLERGLDHTVEYSPEELATAALQNMDIR